MVHSSVFVVKTYNFPHDLLNAFHSLLLTKNQQEQTKQNRNKAIQNKQTKQHNAFIQIKNPITVKEKNKQTSPEVSRGRTNLTS